MATEAEISKKAGFDPAQSNRGYKMAGLLALFGEVNRVILLDSMSFELEYYTSVSSSFSAHQRGSVYDRRFVRLASYGLTIICRLYPFT